MDRNNSFCELSMNIVLVEMAFVAGLHVRLSMEGHCIVIVDNFAREKLMRN